MKIYLAGSISGLSYDEIVARYKQQISFFEGIGFSVLFPMLSKGYLRNEKNINSTGYTQPPSTDKAIVGRDCWMVHQCDIIFADLTRNPSCPSLGTVSELSWAYLLHKHSVVAMPDDSVHQHAFVKQQADIVVPTVQDAFVYFSDFYAGIHAL